METQIINVAIEGIAPLLQHRFFESIGGKPDPNKTDIELAEPYLYKDEDGKIYQPCEHIEGAMQKAAVNFKFKGKKTYKDFIKSGLFVKPYTIVHKLQKWVVDKRPVVIQRSKIMRIRPRFDKWALEFQFEINNAELSYKTLNEILIYSGRYVGIGDYRPKFGRFIVTRYELQK